MKTEEYVAKVLKRLDKADYGFIVRVNADNSQEQEASSMADASRFANKLRELPGARRIRIFRDDDINQSNPYAEWSTDDWEPGQVTRTGWKKVR